MYYNNLLIKSYDVFQIANLGNFLSNCRWNVLKHKVADTTKCKSEIHPSLISDRDALVKIINKRHIKVANFLNL